MNNKIALHINLVTLLFILSGYIATGHAKPEADRPIVCQDNVFDNSEMDRIKDTYSGNQEVWKEFNNFYKERTGRKLAVFMDGTNNDAKSATNIRILYRLTVLNACQDYPIIPYYDKGVGAHHYDNFLGNAFGLGLSLNIRQAYHFLSRTYKEGDEIYLFGFSRGAFTARSLNGFLEFVGLLDVTTDNSPAVWFFKQGDEDITKLYKKYKTKHDGSYNFEQTLKDDIAKFKEKEFQNRIFHNVKVKTIAVFDTVSAAGMGNDDEPDNHRIDLYAETGIHALSLDEQRDEFRLIRFNELELSNDQNLSEVWFPGAHSDVGGGYKKELDCRNINDHTGKFFSSGLSVTPLNWMITELTDVGFFMRNSSDEKFPECRDGRLHDEFFDSKLFSRMGLFRRKPNRGDTLHVSILDRMKLNLCKSNIKREPHNKYHPRNLHHTEYKDFYKIIGESVITDNFYPKPCENN